MNPPIRKSKPLSERIKRMAERIDTSSAFTPVDVSTSTLRTWAREVAKLESLVPKPEALDTYRITSDLVGRIDKAIETARKQGNAPKPEGGLT